MRERVSRRTALGTFLMVGSVLGFWLVNRSSNSENSAVEDFQNFQYLYLKNLPRISFNRNLLFDQNLGVDQKDFLKKFGIDSFYLASELLSDQLFVQINLSREAQLGEVVTQKDLLPGLLYFPEDQSFLPSEDIATSWEHNFIRILFNRETADLEGEKFIIVLSSELIKNVPSFPLPYIFSINFNPLPAGKHRGPRNA